MSAATSINYSGKVAFVTGAGSGIGRATAIAFAKAGASVAAVDISEKGLHETVTIIEAAGGKVLPLISDVTKGASVQAALEATVQTFGRLDVAFNNAGIEQPAQPLAELDEEVWDRIIAVNLKSVFLCMKYQIEIMLRQGSGGAIVNTASGAGVLAIRGQSSYCASKFAVVAASKVAALENADKGIRVNALAPGFFASEMTDQYTSDYIETAVRQRVLLGRMGEADELAAALLFLASDAGSCVTGQTLVVDGGLTIT